MNFNYTDQYELQPRFDSRKSFYKKAIVKITGNESHLYSYGTHVATFKPALTKQDDILEIYGTHSATTLRHIKEFMQQLYYPNMTKKEIEKTFIYNNSQPLTRSQLEV